MMEDFPYIESEIRNLVSTDVALKVDQQLLLGTGVYPELNSVDAVASTFAAGSYALAIQDATLIDLIKVGAAQISDFGQNNKFMANTVLLNPVDAMKMQLLKNADGNYMVPNWITSDGVNIGAMRVIANQLVPVNEAYIFDSSKGTIFQRRGATVELAFENRENFEKELVTVKAYERLNFRVRNVDANAFMHIADITAAIAAILKP
jgi:HK97 family phage major capsid protein